MQGFSPLFRGLETLPTGAMEGILGAMRIAYHFDFSCPYAYLGSTQIEALAARTGAELSWEPMLLGGVFRAVGTPQNMSAGMAPAKARHNLWDMHRWADLWGVPLSMPPGHPVSTVRALRALLAAPADRWPALIRELYAAYWVRGESIAEAETIARALNAAGVSGADAERCLAANDDPAIKAELRRRTDAAVARGIFGAPAITVGDGGEGDAFFWGQDRLALVEAAARGWNPGEPAPAPPGDSAREPTGATLDFYYDFSSPYSYLAATQIEAVARRAGAALRWRPMLLGAVFKQIGMADIPFYAMSEAKRRYSAGDMAMWAGYWGVPFRFSSHFPLRTVKALRLALAAGDRIAPLSHALYRAAWVDDRDLGDDAVLRDALTEAGLDADALLARTADPEIKQALFSATSEAVERGVFGAPTCVVTTAAGTEHLFWGQDRLDLVEKALTGWTPPQG